MPGGTSGELTAQREKWFREIQDVLLWPVKDTAALGKSRLREDLGDPGLVRALMVARIAMRLARGERAEEIVKMLATSPVFSTPRPTSAEHEELISKVELGFERYGLATNIVTDGLGLLPWNPESTYMLLTEYWAAQRGRTVPRHRVEQELTDLWDTNHPGVLTAHSSLPALPLEGYPDIWEELKAEPDARVGNAAAFTLTERGGDRAWDQWMASRTWSPLRADHLQTIGGDLVRCKAARRVLGHLIEQAPADAEFRGVLERAAEIFDKQLENIALAVDGMSAIEFGLLRERSEDEHFQDSCLTTFQAHLLDRYSSYEPPYDQEATHSTWGPLPWWSVIVRDERQRQAALGILTRGGLQLKIEATSRDADEVHITCHEPGLGPSGLTACLRFMLRDPVQACELLLVARRQSVTVDFLLEEIDAWDCPQFHLLGALNISLDSPADETLTDIATRALRRLLPGASGTEHYDEPITALDRLLKASRLPDTNRFSA
ncbi:hypothetical protein [Streptomyces sp. SD15]